MPSTQELKERDALVAAIKEHPEAFQANFQFIVPVPKRFQENAATHRVINVSRYQNEQMMVSHYHKHISRTWL